MAKPRGYKIDAAFAAYIRAGIKWDALPRDKAAEAYGIMSIKDAKKKSLRLPLKIVMMKIAGIMMRFTILLGGAANRLDRMCEFKKGEIAALKLYLSQEKMASFDLDLCTFCYDANGTLIGYTIADVTHMKGETKWDPAFIHSGDDMTGTGDAVDEELVINLHGIDPAAQHVFIFVVSNNHGFNRVKGGSWSVVSTMNEEELMAGVWETTEQHRAFVMGKMTRQDHFWLVKEVAEFCPLSVDRKIPMVQRIDQMLTAQYPLASAANPND